MKEQGREENRKEVILLKMFPLNLCRNILEAQIAVVAIFVVPLSHQR